MRLPATANIIRRGGWLLLLFLLWGCADPSLECSDPAGCVALRAADPMVVASLLDDVDPLFPVHEDIRSGIRLALADRGDELLGHTLIWREWDAGCTAETAVQATQDLLADRQVVGAIGTMCSESALGALPLLQSEGMVLVSPADRALTAAPADPPPVYFRTIYNNRLQADLMAQFAYETLGARTAVVIYSETDYTNSLADAFVDRFTMEGGIIQLARKLAPAQTDLTSLMELLAAFPPDVVYVALFEPEAINLVVQVHELANGDEVQMLGADSLLVESFARSAGNAADGMYVTGTAVTGAAYGAARDRWATRFPTLPVGPYHAYAYDAVDLLLDGVEAVAQQGSDGSLLIGRSALRATIAATQDRPALTGRLTCDTTGECAAMESLVVFQLADLELPDSVWPPVVVWSQQP